MERRERWRANEIEKVTVMEIEHVSARFRGRNKLSVAVLSQEAGSVYTYERGGRIKTERRGRVRQKGKQAKRGRGMRSEGEGRGQRCAPPSSSPSVQQLSTALFISPSVLPLSVCLSCLPRCWYMTDPGEDVEVPCGQESQVGK